MVAGAGAGATSPGHADARRFGRGPRRNAAERRSHHHRLRRHRDGGRRGHVSARRAPCIGVRRRARERHRDERRRLRRRPRSRKGAPRRGDHPGGARGGRGDRRRPRGVPPRHADRLRSRYPGGHRAARPVAAVPQQRHLGGRRCRSGVRPPAEAVAGSGGRRPRVGGVPRAGRPDHAGSRRAHHGKRRHGLGSARRRHQRPTRGRRPHTAPSSSPDVRAATTPISAPSGT